MRIFIHLVAVVSLMVLGPAIAFGQTQAERQQIGKSSVSMIQPAGIRKAPSAGDNMRYLPAFRVVEEPKSFVKIWTPRLTDKKIAKAFAKQSGTKLKDMLTLEIDGQTVPVIITRVKSAYRSGDVYKALFDAENSVLVIATVFDDAPITRDDVLEAFKTIRIDVKNPIGDFDDAPFEVDLVAPFEFVFSSFNALFIKSYPEIDDSYSRPSIAIGYEDIFVYNGQPVIDSTETAARHLFPIDDDNFYQEDRPTPSKVKIIAQGYETIGPGRAYKVEATYKDRMAIQYVWDIQGKSEFDDYLFLFAMGDKDHLAQQAGDVAKIAGSLRLKDKNATTAKTAAVVTTRPKPAPTPTPAPVPRVAAKPHPLSACEVKRRKLTCEAMQSHSGFIFTTNLRNGRDTVQYQMAALTSSLRNQEFSQIYEQQVRDHLIEAIPLAADLIGWDMDDPATTEMLSAANAALAKLVISPQEMTPDPQSEDLNTRFGMQKVEFDGGRFYGNRSSIMNNYSLYIDKPDR